MKQPLLTLTRNRQIGAVCWALVLLAQLCALRFPSLILPGPLRVLFILLLLAAAAAIVTTTLGLWTEKGDERAEENDHKSNSALFTCLFLAMGALLFCLEDGGALMLTREAALILFATVCLAKDLLFLVYERFGR